MLRVFLFMLFRVVVVCLLFDRELCMLDLCRCHSCLNLLLFRSGKERDRDTWRERERESHKEATN